MTKGDYQIAVAILMALCVALFAAQWTGTTEPERTFNERGVQVENNAAELVTYKIQMVCERVKDRSICFDVVTIERR
jgi:hypothetical protein